MHLAWPAIIEQILLTAATYVDTAMIGALGYHATATMAVDAPITWLISGLMTAFGVGYSVQIALNDPTQFEQVDETCEFGGAVLYSESLGITAFFENAVPSKYETQKLKQLQFGIENEKIRQFEHECLIRLFQWSFLPPGKALDFSVCDEAFGCYKTQYRKRYLLEICQNASFLSTPDIVGASIGSLAPTYFILISRSALAPLLLLFNLPNAALVCGMR